MDLGAHLPQLDIGPGPSSLEQLEACASAAAELQFAAIAANDHLVFARPWIDGPAALAAVLHCAGSVEIATTVALPVVRGPIAVAKTLATLDHLAGGRVIAGLGPGSSAADYRAMGLDFAERWRRFDEAIRVMRALWNPSDGPFEGSFYSSRDIALRPGPVRRGGPPIWIGSWGSDAGLRRVARLGDGWLASAYNTTPEELAVARRRLERHLGETGRSAAGFPTAVATMFLHLTDDPTEAARLVDDHLAPALGRDSQALSARLLVGSAEHCSDILEAYARAGVSRVYVWPLVDHVDQREAIAHLAARL